MTYDEYINNPMGVKNAVISNREMYRKSYTEKLDKILVRETGHVEYKLYKDKNTYYCYMNIPSEVVPDVYYDVIIEFSKPKSVSPLENTLSNYEVRFFSNDPSFMFSFCHAFMKNKIFLTEFSDKMSNKALKERGKEKNPKDIVGYVKSLYFAYLIMKRKGLFKKVLYLDKYNESYLKRKVMHADRKLAERQSKEDKIKKPKKLSKAPKGFEPEETTSGAAIRNTKMTRKVRTIKSTNNINKTNRVKRTKTI